MKAKTRKLTALFLSAAMALTMTACGNSAATENEVEEEVQQETAQPQEAADNVAPTAQEGRKTTADSDERYEKICIGLQSDPKDLAPENTSGDNSLLYVNWNYYEQLFDYRNNDYVPILAKGYTEVDDLHWQVEIYDYIYDSEGNHITADDVIFCYDNLVNSGKALKYDKYDHIEKVDDYTVEFVWTSPIDGIGDLEWPWCRTHIYSQKAYEEGNFHEKPIATGPYKVAEYTVGSRLVLEANDNYWQKDELRDPEHLANVQTIEYDIIAETSQHVIALSTGQIQYSEYVPTENLDEFRDGGQYADGNDVYTTQGSGLRVLMGNNDSGSPMSDVNLRKAVFYALDNEAIAAAAGTGLPAKAVGTSFFPDYCEAWESAEGNYMAVCDPELAKEYLEKSSYNGEVLKILGSSNEVDKNIMTMMQALLLNVGIETEIVAEDEALAQSDALDPTKWDMLITNAGGGCQSGEWNRFTNYNEFGNGFNMAYIHDDKLQDYLTLCNSLEGHTEENMTEMHQYYLDNAYYHALTSTAMNGVYSEDFATLVYRESEFLRAGACDYYLD